MFYFKILCSRSLLSTNIYFPRKPKRQKMLDLSTDVGRAPYVHRNAKVQHGGLHASLLLLLSLFPPGYILLIATRADNVAVPINRFSMVLKNGTLVQTGFRTFHVVLFSFHFSLLLSWFSMIFFHFFPFLYQVYFLIHVVSFLSH